jgi:hypothetical protein
MGVEFWVLKRKNKENGCFSFSNSLLYYGRKHRAFEALRAGVLGGHPLWPSASCSCIVTDTVTITTPNNASADTMAITANVVVLDISKSYQQSFF